MKTRTILSGLMMAGALMACGSSPRLAGAASAPVERVSFDAALVAKGAALAAIGNCRTCHTRADGESFAGGLPLATPFGTIYSTNITPDPDTGIGRWSGEDFARAMREGVDRAGRQLYPAFPYDHFTRVTDGDIAALYAFVMTREPVRARSPANRLRFPAGFRPTIAAWKALFFRPGAFRPDPAQSAVWNRGAYLVEGLGHCGACHTPRNPLGAEEKGRDLDGGETEHWHASSLAETSPAALPWSAEALYDYLRHGHEQSHGLAAGPMAPVAQNLAGVPEDDVRAIAVYVAARMREPGGGGAEKTAVIAAKRREGGAAEPPSAASAGAAEGASIFAGACASCHGPATSAVALGLTTSLNAPDPRNLIHITLAGLWPEPGAKGSVMPGFDGELTDAQLIALVDYLRGRLTDKPAWTDIAQRLQEVRQAMHSEP